jgi:hypothetical protein
VISPERQADPSTLRRRLALVQTFLMVYANGECKHAPKPDCWACLCRELLKQIAATE